MKRMIAMLLALVMVLSLAACTSAPADDQQAADAPAQDAPVQNDEPQEPAADDEHEPVTIRWASQQVGWEDSIRTILENFQKEYPWITVEWDANSDETTYYANLAADIQEGKGPAIFEMHPRSTYYDYINAGLVLDQSDMEYMANYQDAAYVCTEANGGNYGYLVSFNYICVLYNADIFNELGLKPATNYEEFLQLCADLKAAGYAGIGYPGQAVSGNWFGRGCILGEMSAADYCNLRVGMDNGSVTGISDNAAVVSAFETMKDYHDKELLHSGAQSASLDAVRSLLAQKEVAMIIDGTFTLATAEEVFGDMEIGLMPIFTKSSSGTYFGMGSMIECINANMSEAETEAAKLLLNYFASPEVAGEFCNTHKTTSTINGVVLDFVGGELLTDASANTNIEVFGNTVNSDYWQASFYDLFRQVLFDGADVSTVLAAYDEQLSSFGLAG